MFQQAGANNFLHTSQKFDFEPPSLLCVSLLVPSPNSLEISQIWVPSTSFDISQSLVLPSTSFDISQTLVLPSTSLDISQNRVPSTSPDISQIWVPCSLNITRHLSTLLSPNSLDTIRWPPGSKQAFRSGQPLAAGYKACLWSIIGDLDYFVSSAFQTSIHSDLAHSAAAHWQERTVGATLLHQRLGGASCGPMLLGALGAAEADALCLVGSATAVRSPCT